MRRARLRDPVTRVIHVIGAGLAGLTAAVRLSEVAGLRVILHEASPKAGGRCRSYFDARLERRIDNGNHLILSGNGTVLDFARRTGGAGALETLPEAAFPFVDLATGGRWTVRAPRTPLGLMRRDGRPPGAGAEAVSDALRLLAAGSSRTVAEVLRGRGVMWRTFWEPMTLAVLNAPPDRASAALLRAALARTFFRGAAACRPILAPHGLGAALVDPALALLRSRGVAVRFRAPLIGIGVAGGRARDLAFAGAASEALGPEDAVVLAVPPASLGAVLPEVSLPRPGMAILNAHFRVPEPAAARVPRLLGVMGASVQWIFSRGDVVSATVSAAEATPAWALPKAEALALLWAETANAAELRDCAPLGQRLVRERGATFDQSPDGVALRPGLRTGLANVVLAGDHVRGGLPASLEGAVRSGYAAAAWACPGSAVGRTLAAFGFDPGPRGSSCHISQPNA